MVDLSARHGAPAERETLAETIREAFHHVGFVIITNHGVGQDLIDAVFGLSRAFFRLPLDQKLLIDKRNSRHFRGWEPEGAESTNNRPDLREQIDLWSEHPVRDPGVLPVYLRLLGPNQWLPEEVLPGFRVALGQWFTDLGGLADDLMALLACGLALPEDHFDRLFGTERMSFTKLIRYPATPPGSFGVNAHHDAGFLTVLAPGETPGLEVENAAGDWVPVPVMAGSLVVNVGEMLQAMTGNYYVATPHRVVTRAERHSVGYFHGPSLDTRLTPLALDPRFARAVAASPCHVGAGFMAQSDETEAGVNDMDSPHHPAVYGEQIWNYLARSYPDNVRRLYPDAAHVAALARH